MDLNSQFSILGLQLLIFFLLLFLKNFDDIELKSAVQCRGEFQGTLDIEK